MQPMLSPGMCYSFLLIRHWTLCFKRVEVSSSNNRLNLSLEHLEPFLLEIVGSRAPQHCLILAQPWVLRSGCWSKSARNGASCSRKKQSQGSAGCSAGSGSGGGSGAVQARSGRFGCLVVLEQPFEQLARLVPTILSFKTTMQAQEVRLMPGSAGCAQIPPTAPTNLRAVAGDGRVVLTWDRPANGECCPVSYPPARLSLDLALLSACACGLPDSPHWPAYARSSHVCPTVYLAFNMLCRRLCVSLRGDRCSGGRHTFIRPRRPNSYP